MSYYDEHDQDRWVPEPPGNPERSAFERDRARVLHSAALRRLAAKTQVVGPGETFDGGQHIPRTRLTHSLECAQVGREMGATLGVDPDLVETACLAHDLGHPPFGHNGEVALNALAETCGGFEGNAQSLRLLTRLEAKVLTEDGTSAGLNLTRAALDASIKYPWTCDKSYKFGVYDDDLPVFEWIREGAPEGRVSFEAQIMDWADDVAYSVHDLEDALHLGHVTPEALLSGEERRQVCEITRTWYAPGADLAELEAVFDKLITDPLWPRSFAGTLADLAGLKALTSGLIGRFCRSAQAATKEVYGSRHRADLVVPRATRLECALLKGVVAHYVMTTKDHHANQARQRDLITELAELITQGAPGALEPAFRPAYLEAPDDAARVRVVIDQIASLTDTSAVAWHRRLTR
ncbi:deoxyguanosinetriphosphate triphosphohydrolase [Nonomuraea sp. KC401]|uniref:deoxyguanosinetriphosphate triphosphohydrolase n=1 Tax=unclassified Nonomuraea TaxID=2593643 RepID=UPI0010FEB053|nr:MULTISPECIES: deoxyguanosinetriphosphate triphosphohydrolase [unclassified Nonomuraea]NBF00401.1 deoxyguanosinetriphosphate triphosphohydrolase [Nonomuraea sp. K271]TLF49735.1 deoxyguanosinetriphosphate triphosphohydrolase [Nonomuraea sp. KC401]